MYLLVLSGREISCTLAVKSVSLNQTLRYYHSRNVNTSTSAASATAASPGLQLRTSDDTDSVTPGPSAAPHTPADLPSFMEGVRVFFYNLAASERKRLARYLITYPFRERATAPCLWEFSSVWFCSEKNPKGSNATAVNGNKIMSKLLSWCALMMERRRRSWVRMSPT